MKEVEILVQTFDSKEKILESLKQFSFKGAKETIDTYYFDPLRNNLQVKGDQYPRERFRIRSKQWKSYLTYKKDIFDDHGEWMYSDEHETIIDNYETGKEIILHLGLEELITVDNIKHTFETPLYEIVFEEVKDLGFFLEVERLEVSDDEKIEEVKKEIREFINKLQLNSSEKLNIWKPELMLKKKFQK